MIEAIINYLRPVPSPVKLIKVGTGSDGTYLIPDDLEGVTDCFSPGGCGYKYFEDYLLAHFGIRSHICDPISTISDFTTSFSPGKQTFRQCWLSDTSSSDSITLQDWVEEELDELSNDLILQMDIEGAEHSILSSVNPNILKNFRIIVIELHDFSSLIDSPEHYNKILSSLKALTLNHASVHIRANNSTRLHHHPGVIHYGEDSGANLPDIVEVTFLRKDRFESINTLIDPEIPHILDIFSNVYLNPPLHLNEGWLPAKRRSHLASLKIDLDYAHHYYSSIKYGCARLPKYLIRIIVKLFHIPFG